MIKMDMEDNDTMYLDISLFAEGCRQTRLAYVCNTKAGMTKMQTGFYTFFVKDRKANLLRAQLFDVKDFLNKGLLVKHFENKPVKITFIPQIYNGQWSLLIDEISIWEGDFDYKIFRGTVNVNYEGLSSLAKRIMGDNWVINREYATVSLPSLCAGHCGGFLKLLSTCAYSLTQYNNLPDIAVTDVLKVYFYVMDYYYRFLIKRESVVIDQSEIFALLKQLDLQVQDEPLRLVVADTARALLLPGIKSQHIIAHLITSTVQNVTRNLELVYLNSTLTPGTLTVNGGEELLRY